MWLDRSEERGSTPRRALSPCNLLSRIWKGVQNINWLVPWTSPTQGCGWKVKRVRGAGPMQLGQSSFVHYALGPDCEFPELWLVIPLLVVGEVEKLGERQFFFFFSWSWHKNSRHACRWQRIARGAFSSGGLGQQTADAGTGSSLPLASRTPGKGATACTSATNSQEAVSIALSATVTTGSANTELGGLSPAL